MTQGTHSAKVVFPTDGFMWTIDFSLNLSDLACSMIENAGLLQPTRALHSALRHHFGRCGQPSYFNEHYFIANALGITSEAAGGLRTNYGGVQFEIDSYSCAVELPELVCRPIRLPA